MSGTFTHDGVQYQWFGGFGSIFSSRERGVKVGDLRYINGRIFRVYMLTGGFWPLVKTVHWTLPGNINVEELRKIHREMFGVE